jgi:hypothetical protein
MKNAGIALIDYLCNRYLAHIGLGQYFLRPGRRTHLNHNFIGPYCIPNEVINDKENNHG